MSKVYIVTWVDRVTRYVKIEAESEEEACEKFKNEEGFSWEEVMESDCEFYQEPWIEEE